MLFRFGFVIFNGRVPIKGLVKNKVDWFGFEICLTSFDLLRGKLC